MNTIGNKAILAIAYKKLEEIDRYQYGHFAIWLRGILIGEYDEVSTLTICNSYLRDFLANKDKRRINDSEKKSAEELFNTIYEAFFISPWNEDKSILLSEYREIFWLDEVGEYSFRDKLGMILIDEPNLYRQRIIWKDFLSGKIKEDFIPLDYFDETAIEYLKSFD